MQEVKASEFKAKCLKIMDEVAETGESVVITKRGVPVAELIPVRERKKRIFGSMRGSVEIIGDIDSPIDVEWNAKKDSDPMYEYPWNESTLNRHDVRV